MNIFNTLVITICAFAAALFLSGCSHQKIACQSSWKITGFYTPISTDFGAGLDQRIKIKNFKALKFNSDFINAVKLEGWGKTRFDWYLGYYGGQWHKENSPLNSLGLPLAIGAVAVDNQLIAKNTTLQIPAIEKIMDISHFQAVDVGSAIKRRHVDVYTGEGEKAKKRSFEVTGTHQVCFSAQAQAPVVGLSR